MHVVHIVTNLARGGAELMLKRLVEQQMREGRFRHTVISLREKATVGPEIEALGIEVIALGLKGFAGAPLALWRLRRRLRQLKPDLVQTWLYHADLIGGLAARWAGVRNVVWSVRSTEIAATQGTSSTTTLIRRCCALLSRTIPKRIVYVAEAAKIVHERLGYDASKSVVIPNGYRLPPERAMAASRASVRRELGLTEGHLVVGTVGRFIEVKDYPTFIAAADGIADRFPMLRFLMIGRGLDPENQTLAGWVSGTRCPERFMLIGERSPLEPFLPALDLFCLHSVAEGFPNVVAEAMAARVPCVVTDVGDAALLVGETGLVVPPGRPVELGDALARMLVESPEDRALRGQAARRRISDRFSIAAVQSMYENVYAQLGLSPPEPPQVVRAEPLG